MAIYWILDEYGKPKVVEDVLEWARWFEACDRHIRQDEIDGVQVSTVFLGIDHSFNSGTPILYETMIFGGEYDEWQRRYCTEEEATAGHIEACRMVREGGAAI